MSLNSFDPLLFPFSHKDVKAGTSPRGCVYGIADALNREIVKIGFSTAPIERVETLNRQTASNGMLHLVFWFDCDSAFSHEQQIFKALDHWRVKRLGGTQRKEFFQLSPLLACVCLSEYFERDPDVMLPDWKSEYQRLKRDRMSKLPKSNIQTSVHGRSR